MTTIYLLNEIQAIGVVKAAGKNQALLHVIPEKRDFSAPIGTRFFFGTLAAITSDGLKFSTGSGSKLLQWEPSPNVVERPPKPPVTSNSSAQKNNPVQELQNAVRDWQKKKASEPQTKPQGTMIPKSLPLRNDDPMRAAALAIVRYPEHFADAGFPLSAAGFSTPWSGSRAPIRPEGLMVGYGWHRAVSRANEWGQHVL